MVFNFNVINEFTVGGYSIAAIRTLIYVHFWALLKLCPALKIVVQSLVHPWNVDTFKMHHHF
jgi:hypothetical protein